ncbi:MAG: sigma-54 interaction domain-containing protein, partial [Bryobacteraceae bacterium]
GRIQAEHCRFLLLDCGLAVDICRSVAGSMGRLESRGYDAVVVDWRTLEVEHLGTGDWREGWLRLARAARAANDGPVGLVALFGGEVAVHPELDQVGAVAVGHSDGVDAKVMTAAVTLAIERSGSGVMRSKPAAQAPPTLSAEDYLFGHSPAIRGVIDQVQLVAPKDTTVLVTGETGTGKERVSFAIHLLSRRQRLEMVSVNCGGIPATLLEDEFFGHVKGAFTDARTARVGRFEQAHGSTIFLDEIGDLPLELQPKLLRVVQEREIHRIGGVEAVQLDVRVIAATNVDLWRRVEQGRFREDLFYRINVYHIHIPPLRERREDIPLFIEYFLERISRRDRLPRKRLALGAEAPLMKLPWRGNIRELENAVEIAAIRSQERTEVTAEDFPPSREAPHRPAEPISEDGADFKTLVMRYERDLILRALERAQGNKNRAAQILRLKRTTLIEKLKRFESL